METVVTKRSNGSKRVQLSFEGHVTKTDQAPAKEMTMASIVKKIQMGNLSMMGEFQFSMDVPEVSSYQDIFEHQQKAIKMYERLPTEVKNLMGDNPLNLEQVLLDPKNADLLKKYGMIVDGKTIQQKNHDEIVKHLKDLKVSESSEVPEPPKKAKKTT